MAPDPYTPQRLVLMTTLAAVLAPLAYLLGFMDAAVGIVAGTPVAMLNFRMTWLGLTASNRISGPKSAGVLWQCSLLRLLLDVLCLTAAAFISAEFVLGVLTGLLLELMTYYVDAVKVVLAMLRGDTVWKRKSGN